MVTVSVWRLGNKVAIFEGTCVKIIETPVDLAKYELLAGKAADEFFAKNTSLCLEKSINSTSLA